MNAGRLDRYQQACMLAQLILEGNPRHDELRIAQALDDIRDEVAAGRKNQAEYPAHAKRALQLIEEAGWSVKAPPPLRVVK